MENSRFFAFSICKVNPLGTLAALTFKNLRFVAFFSALDPRLWGVLHFSSGKHKTLEVVCFASEVLAGVFMVSGCQI